MFVVDAFPKNLQNLIIISKKTSDESQQAWICFSWFYCGLGSAVFVIFNVLFFIQCLWLYSHFAINFHQLLFCPVIKVDKLKNLDKKFRQPSGSPAQKHTDFQAKFIAHLSVKFFTFIMHSVYTWGKIIKLIENVIGLKKIGRFAFTQRKNCEIHSVIPAALLQVCITQQSNIRKFFISKQKSRVSFHHKLCNVYVIKRVLI